jgi:hypothetical protein
MIGAELALVPFGTTDVVPMALGGWTESTVHFSSLPWGGGHYSRADDSPASIDANGWPTSDAYIILTLAQSFKVDPARFLAAYGGNFSMSFKGNAQLYFPPEMNATVSGLVFDNTTFSTTLTVTVPQPPLGGLFGFVVGFGDTRRNATAPTNSGITDLVVSPDAQSNRASPGNFWGTPLLSSITPLHHVRTMQWTYGWQASGEGGECSGD